MPASVDAGIESTAELNQQTDPLSREAWYDVDDSCYVVDDCSASLLDGGVAPTLAQDHHTLV